MVEDGAPRDHDERVTCPLDLRSRPSPSRPPRPRCGWPRTHGTRATFHENRIAVRFAYEWRDDGGFWYRAHGNEQWEFDAQGLMCRREASINDVPIAAADRKFHWPRGPRPQDHPGLTEHGL